MTTSSFDVFSGGTVTFDLDICARCETKACIAACNAPSLACVLELKDGLPGLRVSAEAAAKGACIECLACELDCQSKGLGGVSFVLPMPELDRHIAELGAADAAPGFAARD